MDKAQQRTLERERASFCKEKPVSNCHGLLKYMWMPWNLQMISETCSTHLDQCRYSESSEKLSAGNLFTLTCLAAQGYDFEWRKRMENIYAGEHIRMENIYINIPFVQTLRNCPWERDSCRAQIWFISCHSHQKVWILVGCCACYLVCVMWITHPLLDTCHTCLSPHPQLWLLWTR